jgi:hypothetical protein
VAGGGNMSVTVTQYPEGFYGNSELLNLKWLIFPRRKINRVPLGFCIHEEIKSRLISGNVCLFPLQKLLSSRLLSVLKYTKL